MKVKVYSFKLQRYMVDLGKSQYKNPGEESSGGYYADELNLHLSCKNLIYN